MKKKYFLLVLALILTLCGCSRPAVILTLPKMQSTNTTSKSGSYIKRHPKASAENIGGVNVIVGKHLNFIEDAGSFDNNSGYFDLRDSDLSNAKLNNNSEELNNSYFSTHTKWPKDLPKDFNPNTILKLGKNQGLGINKLHSEGIDGRGINIAMIDQTLLVDHEEIKNQIKFYDEINCAGEKSSMHGPAMASLAVGKSIGVAPKANLYFVGCDDRYNNLLAIKNGISNLNFIGDAKAIDKILEINQKLSLQNKIRVLSISAAWCPYDKGYKEITEAIERAKNAGIFVITANIFDIYNNKFWYYGVDRKPMDDPEKQTSYKPHNWKDWISFLPAPDFKKYYEKKFDSVSPKEFLLVPMSSKTLAGYEGTNDYTFNRIGGWSSVEPYLAGLYAMCCQVKPDITPDIFWSTALKTGDTMEIKNEGKETKTGKLINPVKLIDSLK